MPVIKEKAPLIKWLKFARVRYGITWEEVEKALGWNQDSISGIDLSSFTYLELTSIKYKLIKLIHEKKGVDLGRVDL